MIVKQDFLNKLKDFGLNSYESKLWISLLSRGISSAGELSDIANVPRSRTYDVLESLEKKGFIIMKLGKPIKYIAVSPEEVVDRVKKKITDEAHVNTTILEDLKQSDIMDELNLLHSQGVEMVDPSDMSGLLKGRKNLYNHYESMINSANESIMMMTTEQGIIRKVHHLSNSFQKAHKRGVNTTILGNFSEDTITKIKQLIPFVMIAKSEDLSGRFMVVDNQNVTVALLDGDDTHPSYDGGIWINTPFFAKTLSGMFNCLNKKE